MANKFGKIPDNFNKTRDYLTTGTFIKLVHKF